MSLYLEIPDWGNALPFRVFENKGEVIVAPHWHKEIEIIYVTKGFVNIGYNDQLVQVHEGEVFTFGSGESHYFLGSPDSNRVVYQFDLSLFRDVHLKDKDYKEIIHLFERGENHSAHWEHHVTEKVVSCLNGLLQENTEQQSGYEFATLGRLHQLLTIYHRDIPPKIAVSNTGNFVETVNHHDTLERLNSIFIFIEGHYQTGITLDEVAKFVGFSPYYFSRFFKKNTGKTFMQFLTEYRISQAKYILSHEKVAMIEVAERSGFNSVKTFHHVFKEQVGMSPLKYHKTIFGNNR